MPKFEVIIKRTEDDSNAVHTQANFLGVNYYEAIGALRVIAAQLEENLADSFKAAPKEVPDDE